MKTSSKNTKSTKSGSSERSRTIPSTVRHTVTKKIGAYAPKTSLTWLMAGAALGTISTIMFRPAQSMIMEKMKGWAPKLGLGNDDKFEGQSKFLS